MPNRHDPSIEKVRGRPRSTTSLIPPDPAPYATEPPTGAVRVVNPIDVVLGKRYYVRWSDLESQGEFIARPVCFVRQYKTGGPFIPMKEVPAHFDPETGARVPGWTGVRFDNGVTVAALTAEYYLLD